jgi:hypothetical protein
LKILKNISQNIPFTTFTISSADERGFIEEIMMGMVYVSSESSKFNITKIDWMLVTGRIF